MRMKRLRRSFPSRLTSHVKLLKNLIPHYLLLTPHFLIDSAMLKEGLHALRSGHWPSLLGAWLHFEVSFMVWLLVGALSIAISEEFGLSAFQKGVLVGIPLLGGSLLRIVIGPLGDRAGAKSVGLAILGLEALALILGWQWGTNFSEMLIVGLLLGIAGASFVIALPLASQAYPPAHQGLAMGVAAVGNSGVLLAAIFAPRLAVMFGWHQVFAFMLVPVDRKSTRLNSSHTDISRMPSSA